MVDFARIVLDNEFFYEPKQTPDMCIAKNDGGQIVLHGNTQEVVDFVYKVLSNSVARATYSDPKYGLEYVLSKLIGPSIDYSSNLSFIEEDYDELVKGLKNTKSFKVITTKKFDVDDE